MEHTMPEYHIVILDVVIPVNPRLDAMGLMTLVSELAGSIQLVVAVLGHPDGFTSEGSTTGTQRSRTGQHHLARGRVQLIGDRFVGDGVGDVIVTDFKDTVASNVRVSRRGLG